MGPAIGWLSGRGYRGWLSLYPEALRAEREDEMAAVLMQGADPDQTRPKAGPAANLAMHGLRRRAGRRLPGDWERAQTISRAARSQLI